MTDSDSDSFHSACEDLDIDDDKKLDTKTEDLTKEIDENIVISSIKSEDKKSIDIIQKDLKCEDSSSNSECKSSSSDIIKSDSDNQKNEEGWEDFGDEADVEGDSEMEKVESDEGEYYHRQMLDKKLMPPPPLPSKNEDEKHSGGLFDWKALQNVVTAVGEGISNAVETGLGIPPPEEIAKLSTAERRKIFEESQKIKEPEPSLSSDEGGVSPEGSIHGLPIHHRKRTKSGNGFSSFLGGFGSIVNGSLDVLENLGKKTFETLTVKDESDKRRFILQPGRESNLSDILKELKESEDNSTNNPSVTGYGNSVIANTGISFLKEFEDNDGFVHLECFELLSKDYLAEKVSNKHFMKFDDKLSTFCLEDVSECSTDEFLNGIKKQTTKFISGFNSTPLTKTNDDLTDTLTDLQNKIDKGEDIHVDEFHRYAIISLAKLTSKAIECLCRLVQQMIISQSRPDMDSVFTFTYLICRRLSFFASQYANLLSLLKQDSKVEEAVTNIFFECSNACLYLKKALELVRPFMPDDGYIFNPKADIITDSTISSVKQNKTSDIDGEWENW